MKTPIRTCRVAPAPMAASPASPTSSTAPRRTGRPARALASIKLLHAGFGAYANPAEAAKRLYLVDRLLSARANPDDILVSAGLRAHRPEGRPARPFYRRERRRSVQRDAHSNREAKVPTEPFRLWAYWGNREETAQHCAVRSAQMLGRLEAIDASFARWCEMGDTLGKAYETFCRMPPDVRELTRIFDANRNGLGADRDSA